MLGWRSTNTGIAVADHWEDAGMSHGDGSPRAGDERPGFEPALRGYDRQQVDQYLAHLDREIAKLSVERNRALGQVKDLTAEVQKLRAELGELQGRPPQLDKATFRDLGPMVDQMLVLAEKQA